MKQWLTAHVLSREDLDNSGFDGLSKKEFLISLSLIVAALSAFGIIIHL